MRTRIRILTAAVTCAALTLLIAGAGRAQEPTWLSTRADSLRATSFADIRTADYRGTPVDITDVGWGRHRYYSRPSYSLSLSYRYRPRLYSGYGYPLYSSFYAGSLYSRSYYSARLSYGLGSFGYVPSYAAYSYARYRPLPVSFAYYRPTYTFYQPAYSFYRPYYSYFYHSFYRPHYSVAYPGYAYSSLAVSPVYPVPSVSYATAPVVTYTYRPPVLCSGASYVVASPRVLTYSSCYQPYYTYYHPCCPDPCVACLPTQTAPSLQPIPDSAPVSPVPQDVEPAPRAAPADPAPSTQPPDPGDVGGPQSPAPPPEDDTPGSAPTAAVDRRTAGPALLAPQSSDN